ncbi:MAG: hypothetical protein IKQ29_01705 [Bacilli bacterium]|nr:hypothetical protein [Bacilli bacterium]
MKKNDKVIILGSILLIYTILTWFIGGGVYTNGVYNSTGIERLGIFDLFLFVCQAFYIKAVDIFYLLSIGGFYGFASRTKSYRKIVTKVCELIEGREHIAMLVITLLMGLYTSITNNILSLVFITPFIITVYLRRGCDRLTAISAAFGGIFIGFLGQTFGSYGYTNLLSAASITMKSGMLIKVLMFVVSYILYNVFAIMHMNSRIKNPEYVKFDMFAINEVDESKVKPSLRKKIWPTVLLYCLALIVILLAYINWQTSFNVELFSNILKKVQEWELFNTTVLSSLLGNFTAFGNWDIIGVTFILVLVTLIMAISNKISLSDVIDSYGIGIKKISKVAFVYVLIHSLFVAYYTSNWPMAIVHSLLGTEFNIFGIFLGSVIHGATVIDLDYATYYIGGAIATNYVDNLLDSALLIHMGYALVNVIAPTSSILMIALSYLNVPYSKWLKYIWKFVAIMALICLVMIAFSAYA